MDFFPIFLDLKNKPCLVVGGGEVAARKVDLLLSAHARLRLVAPDLCPALERQLAEGRFEHHARVFEEADLEGMNLVIAATGDREVNSRVASLAQARQLPVNVVDDPDLGSFVMPSVIDRSPVQIAVSTGGASPVLARQLRTRLETLIPSAYGRLAELAESFRGKVKEHFDDIKQRRAFWEKVLEGPIAEMVLSGHDKAAEEALEKELAGSSGNGMGEVYLVGGGPGDPDLLTFRALRLMQQADVVLYDRLVSPQIMELVRRDAERIYVGKERDNHAVPQGNINRMLADLAKQGKRVLRLKGGDPFIFGRGGEEIETLAEEGVPFQVVPAVTAAAGCASYAGIPLTHRDYAQSCLFVTGHLKDGTMNLNWDALVQPAQTVVFYMGLKGAAVLSKELIAHGQPEDLPVALVQQGTTRNQRVWTTTLAELPRVVEDESIKPPTLIIVGEVVKLHKKLAWFNSLSD